MYVTKNSCLLRMMIRGAPPSYMLIFFIFKWIKMKSLNSQYLSRIDHLRFIAATFVVFVHSYTAFGGKESSNPFINFMLAGDTGVTLFLVLSGFLFTIISDGEKRKFLISLLSSIDLFEYSHFFLLHGLPPWLYREGPPHFLMRYLCFFSQICNHPHY